MVCRQSRELALFQLDRIADLDFTVSKKGFSGLGICAKSGQMLQLKM